MVRDAIEFARVSAYPDLDDAFDHVFTEPLVIPPDLVQMALQAGR